MNFSPLAGWFQGRTQDIAGALVITVTQQYIAEGDLDVTVLRSLFSEGFDDQQSFFELSLVEEIDPILQGIFLCHRLEGTDEEAENKESKPSVHGRCPCWRIVIIAA